MSPGPTRHNPGCSAATPAWLILWGNLLHYEGSPGLWQTLVHALIRLGLPYSAYSFVSAGLALAAVVSFASICTPAAFHSNPAAIHLLSLLPICGHCAQLCFNSAFTICNRALFIGKRRASQLDDGAAGLLAGVSVHGFLISACIWVTLYAPFVLGWRPLQASERLKLVIAGIAYWSVLVFFMICAWPAKDVAFAEHRGLGNLHLLPDVAKATMAGAFTGYWIMSLVLIALSLPFLWRGGGWLFFLLASAAFFLFGTIVYTQLWHFGILFLAWLFAIWISAYKTRVTAPTRPGAARRHRISMLLDRRGNPVRLGSCILGKPGGSPIFQAGRLATRWTLRHRLLQPLRSSLIFRRIFTPTFTTEPLTGTGPNGTPPMIRRCYSLRTGASWCWWVIRYRREKQHWADLLATAWVRAHAAFRWQHFLADRRL